MRRGIIPISQIARTILPMRGQNVLLDADLARLYGVTTGNLNKAVSRNRERFPDDFMFRLTPDEARNLRFQTGISSWGGRKFADLEKRVGKHDQKISAIIDAIRQLMAPPEKPKREIGFHVKEAAARYRTRKVR